MAQVGSVVVVALVAFCAPVRAQVPDSAPVAADAAFAAAQKLRQANKPAEAAPRFADFASRYPNDPRAPEAIFLQGEAENQRGQADVALKSWNWLLQRYPISPQAPDALEALMRYHEGKANPAKAAVFGDRLRAAFPQSPAAVRLTIRRGEAMLAAGRPAEAVRLLDPVKAGLNPAQREKLDQTRTSLPGAAETAVHATKPAGETVVAPAEPGSSAATSEPLAAAVVLRAKGQFEQSIGLYEGVLKQSSQRPEWGKAQFGIAECLADNRQLRPAADRFVRLADELPADPLAPSALWRACAIQSGPLGNRGAALKLAEQLRDRYPRDEYGQRGAYAVALLRHWGGNQSGAREALHGYLRDYREGKYASAAGKLLAQLEGRGKKP